MLFIVILGLVLAGLSSALAGRGGGATAGQAAAWMMLFLSCPPACAGMVALLVRRRLRGLSPVDSDYPLKLLTLSRRVYQLSRALELAVVACYTGALWAGWAAFPGHVGLESSALGSRAVLFVPFLLSLVAVWAMLHFAQTALNSRAPTLFQRLSFRIRFTILTVCVPVAVILGLYDLAAFLPATVKAWFDRPILGVALSGLFLFGGYTLAPLVVVRVWKTSRLEDSALRGRLTELCSRIGVGFRDILIWETPGHFFANAAVMGAFAPVRYIIVSRSLIAAMPPVEIEAVFAHELGHAKRHHMLLYLVMATNFMAMAYIFNVFAGVAITDGVTYFVVWTILFALFWGVGFGYVSRRFEREADLFGGRTAGDYIVFANALERIALVNGVSPATRSWRHGSIRWRVDFLHKAGQSEAVLKEFRDKIAFIKLFLVVNLAVAVTTVILLQVV